MTRVAFSVWNQRISPVFDVSQKALVLQIENGAVVSRHAQEFPGGDPMRKVEKLAAVSVDELVCGAISRPLVELAHSLGIEVIAFVAGEIEDVTRAYLQNQLPNEALSMPGCCRARPRTRGTGPCCAGPKSEGSRAGRNFRSK